MKKKTLSILLAVCMLLTVIPMTIFSASADLTGAGTKDDPFIIADYSDLKDFAAAVNSGTNYASKYIVVADSFQTESGAVSEIAGTEEKPFCGEFNGNGKSINVNITSSEANVGLFGYAQGATISNVVVNGNIKGTGTNVGGVVGYNKNGTIKNCGSTAKISGSTAVGGVVGKSEDGFITDCYATGTVENGINAGGIAGEVIGGNIKNSFATADVSGTTFAGGIAGTSDGAAVDNCYAAGEVTGATAIGAVIGHLVAGDVTNCYFIGSKAFGDKTEGLEAVVRDMTEGQMKSAPEAEYALINSLNKNAKEKKYTEWTIDSEKNNGYPFYKKPVPTADNFDFAAASAEYDGSEKSATVKAKGFGIGEITAVKYFKGDEVLDSAPVDAGEYTVKIDVAEGSYYGEQKDITADNWKFSITKKQLTVAGTTARDKVYDGTKNADVTPGTLDGIIGNDEVILKVTGTFANENAGKGKEITVSYSLEGADASNYAKPQDEKLTADILSADVTADKVTASVTIGQALSEAVFEGKAKFGDKEVNGVFKFDDEKEIPKVADSVYTMYDVTFTPAESEKNFNVAKFQMTVKVKPVQTELVIKANSLSKVYDGTPLTGGKIYDDEGKVVDEGYTKTEGILLEGDELKVTFAGSITDAGTAENKIESYTILRNGEEVTKEYNIKPVNGRLTVNRRSITFTSASATKKDDKTSLYKDEVVVSGEGFVGSDSAEFTVTGIQKEKGSSPNYFKYDFTEGTNENNYIVYIVYGTLTITINDKDAFDEYKRAATYELTELNWRHQNIHSTEYIEETIEKIAACNYDETKDLESNMAVVDIIKAEGIAKVDEFNDMVAAVPFLNTLIIFVNAMFDFIFEHNPIKGLVNDIINHYKSLSF